MSPRCRLFGSACVRSAAALVGLTVTVLTPRHAAAQLRAERAAPRTLEVAVAESRNAPSTVQRGAEALAQARAAETQANYALADDLLRQARTDPDARGD